MNDEPAEIIELEVDENSAGARLDRFLPAALSARGRVDSRATLQSWIRDGAVLVNGAVVKPRQAVSAGDRVEVSVPRVTPRELAAEPMELSILHEDDDIIVIDKASGWVVHPGSGHEDGTLVNGLLHHTGGRLSRLAGEDRPGIVHRLDRDTSGCLVAAVTDRAYHSLVGQFSGRETGKVYHAVTGGIPAETRGRIETRIGRHPVHRQRMAVLEPPAGKEAITDFEVVASDEHEDWALLRCVIHTGRTHQIRVHLREVLGCAILGDVIYQPRKPRGPRVDRLMLHAAELRFRHPATDEEMTFTAPLPEAFARFLREK